MMMTNLEEHRIIFYSDVFTADKIEPLKQKLLHYQLDGNEPITIILDSPGGEVKEANAIMDLIQSTPDCPIRVVGLGDVSSAASYLLTCGPSKGNRMMFSKCTYMVHKPFLPKIENTNVEDLKQCYEHMDRFYENFKKEYLAHSSISEEDYDRLFSGAGTTIDAKTALKYGFIDQIVDHIKDLID